MCGLGSRRKCRLAVFRTEMLEKWDGKEGWRGVSNALWPSPSWPTQVVPGCLTLLKILLQRQTPNKMINYQQTEQTQKPWTHGALYPPYPTRSSFLQTSLRVMKTWLSNLPVRSKDADWYLSKTYGFSHMISKDFINLFFQVQLSWYPVILPVFLYFPSSSL